MGGQWKGLERGWCLGDEAFRQELLAQAEGKFGANHYAGQRQESAEEKARRILAEELHGLGWRTGEMEKRLKADPDKVRIAPREDLSRLQCNEKCNGYSGGLAGLSGGFWSSLSSLSTALKKSLSVLNGRRGMSSSRETKYSS